MKTVSNALEVLGLLCVVAGAYLFDWRLAVFVAGLVLLVLGLVLDPPRRDL